MEEQPIISICYPTCNRGKIVYENVKHILGYQSDKIEVVVLDNNSTDNTKELISSFSDNRLRYYRNEENIGFTNLVRILQMATGKYALLVSDEDSVIHSSLDKLIRIAEYDEYALITGVALVGNDKKSGRIGQYKKGSDAIKAIFMNTYMTGYIYNTAYLRKELYNKSITELVDEYGTSYGWLMVAIRLAAQGKINVLPDIICEHTFYGKRDKTATFVNGRIFSSYKERLKQCKICINMLMGCGLSDNEKIELGSSFIRRYSRLGSYSYLNFYYNSNMEINGINREELYKEDLKYFRNWLYIYTKCWWYFLKTDIKFSSVVKYLISHRHECLLSFKENYNTLQKCRTLKRQNS